MKTIADNIIVRISQAQLNLMTIKEDLVLLMENSNRDAYLRYKENYNDIIQNLEESIKCLQTIVNIYPEFLDDNDSRKIPRRYLNKTM